MARKRFEDQETRSRRIMLRFVLGVMILMLLVAYGKVVWIKVAHGEEYAAAAKAQQTSQSDTVLPALRGTIRDAKGEIMAHSERVYNVVLDCKVIITADEVDREATIEMLMEKLNVERDVIQQYLTEDYANDRYELMREGKGISVQDKQELENAMTEGKIVGVWFEEDEARSYPNGSLMAHVLGYNGTYGVEQYYSDYLTGTNGRQMISANAAGSYLEEYIPSQNGADVTLTLDATIQYYMEEELAKGVEEFAAIQGCAIALNPKTGAIYGMAVVPTFDPNEPKTVYNVTDKYKEKCGYTPDDIDYYYQIWKNYAVNDTYEAGSAFKPIFASAALEEGVIGSGNGFWCEGTLDYYGTTIQCAYQEIHGNESIREVMSNSCNIAMTQISSILGVDGWLKYQEAYGIGQRTGIDLIGEVSCASLIYGEDMSPIDLATTAFGQGFNVTPIQLISAFTAVINGGELLKPYVVSKVTDANGNVVIRNNKTVVRNPISASLSADMRDYLKTVVEEGTGSAAKVEGYSIGGKTATSQKVNENHQYEEDKYVCSFIGFSPVDDPEIVLLVILDEADNGTSNQPSEIAARIFKKILPYLNIYPDME